MEKHKGRRGRNEPASIDGIMQTGRQIGFPKSSSYQPNRQGPTPTLGDFSKRTDGFYSAREAMPNRPLDYSETQEAQMLDEPIVLDHIESRKKKQRFWQRHAKMKRRLKRTSLAFMVLILAGGAYFGYKLYHTQKKVLAGGGKAVTVCSDNVDTSELSNEGDSRINILLLGIGGPGHDGANLTDTILLASIDPINDKAVLLSIPRDLWVHIPNNGTQKINAAYADAVDQSKSKTKAGQEEDGIAALDKTLQPVLDGVKIHYHVLLDFSAFKQMVDALGGVTVNVPETLYDPTIAWENHRNPVIAQKGVQTFSGQQALLYVRSRETSSDFARGERQRLVISAVKQKAFSAGTFSNPFKVSNLLDSLGQNVYTDFSSTDIKCLYKQTATIPANAIQSLDMVTPPNELLTTGNMNGLSIVEPRAGLFDYSDIHSFLHTSLKDGLITKENAQVAVYNGTSTSGLATDEAKVLKEYGYHVTTVENAPNTTSPPTTILVDLSKGADKYTRHYLEGRLGVTAVTKLPSDTGITPPANAKFVIILGEDVANSSTQ
ncbi:LCP family protein [Candidatus Saccharibacteria bacterium]|nr:LCP family protein [Candidatus Saccharibacteria bacterium]